MTASALAEERTITLVVTVKGDDGKSIGGALVNVYQTNISGSEFLTRVPDHHDYTNAQGIKRFEIKAEKNKPLKLSIEVSREDMVGARDDVDLGTEYPPQVLRQFFLKSRAVETNPDSETSTVKVRVRRKDNNQGIEGAAVEVTPKSAGGKRFPGKTNANGEVSIITPMSDSFDVTASKEMFGSGKQTLTTKKPQREAGPVEVFLTRDRGTEVSVRVLDDSSGQGIFEAVVVFDGPDYVRAATDGSGNAKLLVTEPGTYNVRVTQQYYDKLPPQQVTVPGDKETQAEEIYLTLKGKREIRDTIDVTVLGRDPGDESNKPKPLPGALVKIGRVQGYTDEKGQTTITGSMDFRVEVQVEAKGYKPQTRTVGLNKAMRYSPGTATVTFTLEAVSTAEDPFDVVVQVVDPELKGIPGAKVTFFSISDDDLFGGKTNATGEFLFSSGHAPQHQVAELRKGLKVKATAPGFVEREISIGPDQLLPMTQARRVSLQLDKDWSELEKAIAALEVKVTAWKTESQGRSSDEERELVNPVYVAHFRAKQLSEEVTAAQDQFSLGMGPGPAKERCRQARELKDEADKIEREIAQKVKESARLLDEATARTAACANKQDADLIADNYTRATKLFPEMDTLQKKTIRTHEKLVKLDEESAKLKALFRELEAKASSLRTDKEAAEKAAQSVARNHSAFETLLKTRANRQIALKAELAVIMTKYQSATIPEELRRRLSAMEGTLATTVVPTTENSIVEEVNRSLEETESDITHINGVMKIFSATLCDIDTGERNMNAIAASIAGAEAKLKQAGDLPAKAEECAKKLAGTTANEVIVPDLKSYTDPSKLLTAARAAGLNPSLVASTDPPAADGGGIVVRQDPLANSKVELGHAITIFLNQKAAQTKAAKPTPTPVITPTPTPPAATEAIVPLVPAGKTLADAKAILSAAGFTAAFDAKGGKPSKQDLEFKTTGAQDPPGGSKAKRGAPVTVSIYQKYEVTASPTATPLPSATAAAVGTMPDLTGLTIDQAVTRLPSRTRVSRLDMVVKPPTPEKALTIFFQTPAPGTKFDTGKEVVVTVKLYGEARTSQETTTTSDPYIGTWSGVNPYKSGGPSEITISKAPDAYGKGEYLILAQGHEFPYPAKSDGTTLSHQFGLSQISYTRSGETLHGTYRFTDFKERVTITESTLRRK